jgi:hypothetical protein
MRAIDKFILHVVHNWTNELNEAYSEAAIKGFIKQFQNQADELHTEIPDETTLRRYINIFDKIKDSGRIKQKDLGQYTLPDLITVATSVEDKDAPKEKIDITPDVVYNNEDSSIVIYNGATEANCTTYGKGERWCITKTSFPTYRGSDYRANPTFYLARNTNLDETNFPLSFVAIQVRNPEETTPENRYVYTNRNNSPNESQPMGFNDLLLNIPWLKDIPDIESILSYIPLSKAEKAIIKFGNRAIPIDVWSQLDLNTKQGYIIRRKDKDLFDDITISEFIRDYLPDYPKLEEYIAKNYGILPTMDLLRNLNYFGKEGNKKSLIFNIQEKVDIAELSKSTIPFNIKQELVKYDKWDTPSDIRLYNTTFSNNPAIAELVLDSNDGEISVNIYLKAKKYPFINAKLKYIANYPQLDRLPFINLIWMSARDIITKDKFNSTLDTAKNDSKSPLIVQDKENGKLVLDSTSYSVYDLEGEAVTKVPSDDEVAQGLLNTAASSPSFQDSTVDIVKQTLSKKKDDLPNLDRSIFTSTIENTPYNKRTISINGEPLIIFKPDNEPDDTYISLFLRKTNDKTDTRAEVTFGNSYNWRRVERRRSMSQSMWSSYFKYLRSTNQSYTSDELLTVMNDYSSEIKRDFIKANPPLSPNNQYAVAYYNGVYYIINKANPGFSKKLSDRRGNMIKAAVPAELLRQVLGQQTTPRPAAQTVPAAPAAQAAPVVQAAPAAQAAPAVQQNAVNTLIINAGLTIGFASLPTSIQQRILAGMPANPRTERTARSRDAELGARGNVTGVAVSGQSKMVIIQLASGANIAQISIQPEARHYVVTSTTSFNMGRVGNFIASLNQRNLSEAARKYIKKYPHKLDKVREVLSRYINEIKKY